jgi:hypothetical protein
VQVILVRVGVDHSFGQWNAPVDAATGKFVYVPIPEKAGTAFHVGCERPYTAIVPAIEAFAQETGVPIALPDHLAKRAMHLDPDFEYLTYGDVGSRRGSHIRELKEDDALVFYAGLKPCQSCEHKLIYAFIGLMVVDEVVDAASVARQRRDENAHTRKIKMGATDIVVRGKPGVSGRLQRCLPIGEYRDRAYRIRHDLLEAWGGLTVKDGYIQRSARPPRFSDPARFMAWWATQQPSLIELNNPNAEPERVVIVHLRQPRRNDPNEMRSDPFYEFGSFGCTGCHRKNLMNPKKLHELDRARLAFVQGGRGEFRLIMLTPPARTLKRDGVCEVKWEPTTQPFRFNQAPLIIDRDGNTDFPALKHMIQVTDRTTWLGRFSSKFRSSRKALRSHVAAEMCQVYRRIHAKTTPAGFATSYVQTLPFPPNIIDTDRSGTYRRLLRMKKANGHRHKSRC